jgi:hypothetical protein
MYEETRAVSRTKIRSDPPGHEVHTPPCRTQNEHVHARAGIEAGSGAQSSAKAMLPQWQLPEVRIASVMARAGSIARGA